MKAVILTLPVLMMAFLLGFTEQSQLTGPATTAPNTTVAKINNDIDGSLKFEEMVVGPGGAKYFVYGSVDYTLSFDNIIYSLSTNLNATINQSGGDDSWTVSSGMSFKSLVGKEEMDVVSESNDFAYTTKNLPLYRLIVEYTVESSGITVTDVKVVSATTAEGV